MHANIKGFIVHNATCILQHYKQADERKFQPEDLYWGRTDLISLTMTLTFNPLWAMVMMYSHAKGQGQRSVGSKDREDANGRTDAIALPDSLI